MIISAGDAVMGLEKQQKQLGTRLRRQLVVGSGFGWWSEEDYSLPHRRQPVHNKLNPWALWVCVL